VEKRLKKHQVLMCNPQKKTKFFTFGLFDLCNASTWR
jgi:hypothetical protein